MITLNLTVPHVLLDAEDGTSDVFACPVRTTTITWQTIFDPEPGSAEVSLEGSLDGETFDILDTSTEVAGEVRTINTNVPFIRATSDEDVTLLVVCKDL